MINDCYNINSHCDGNHVETRWLIFENFIEDFKKISNWELKLEYPLEYHLDISGTNRYSVYTSSWENQVDVQTFDRKHILSAWNVAELHDMALPPCHIMSQFYVSADKKLSCQLYQRSADMFLGVPFNIASYALLPHLIAHVCGLHAGEFIHCVGDAHIYLDHIEQVSELLKRECFDLPTLELNKSVMNIFDFKMADLKLVNYHHHGALYAKMAV